MVFEEQPFQGIESHRCAHLQALPVDKLRHQESFLSEDQQNGGNPRTTIPTLCPWWKRKLARPISNIVDHVGQRQICFGQKKHRKKKRYVAIGMTTQRSEEGGCGFVIKGVDWNQWVTIAKSHSLETYWNCHVFTGILDFNLYTKVSASRILVSVSLQWSKSLICFSR